MRRIVDAERFCVCRMLKVARLIINGCKQALRAMPIVLLTIGIVSLWTPLMDPGIADR